MISTASLPQKLPNQEYGTVWSGACEYTNNRGGGRPQARFFPSLAPVNNLGP